MEKKIVLSYGRIHLDLSLPSEEHAKVLSSYWRDDRGAGIGPRVSLDLTFSSGDGPEGAGGEEMMEVGSLYGTSDGRVRRTDGGYEFLGRHPGLTRPDRIAHYHFFPAMGWALAREGVRDLHAAAVRGGGGGVILIIGPTGAGKSTTAKMLVSLGAEPFAEDRTLVRLGGDTMDIPMAIVSPFLPNPFARWAGYDPRTDLPPRRIPEPPPREEEVGGIVFVSIGSGEAKLERLGPSGAAARIMATYPFGDTPHPSLLDLAAALGRLPAFSLTLGHDTIKILRPPEELLNLKENKEVEDGH